MTKTADTRVPKKVLDLLKKDYLEDDEVIIEIVHEAYVPRIDFRWLVLTNQRFVVAIRNLIQVTFLSFTLDGLSIQYTRGVFFDVLEVQQMTNKYRATLYSLDRPFTLDFIDQIKDATKKFQEEKQKTMNEVNLEPLQALENLDKLKSRGEVSPEEYQKLKKEILENLKKE